MSVDEINNIISQDNAESRALLREIMTMFKEGMHNDQVVSLQIDGEVLGEVMMNRLKTVHDRPALNKSGFDILGYNNRQALTVFQR